MSDVKFTKEILRMSELSVVEDYKDLEQQLKDKNEILSKIEFVCNDFHHDDIGDNYELRDSILEILKDSQN